MSDLRYKLEALCTELKDVQKTLKKAGKSRKRENISDIRKLARQAAERIEKSLANVEIERFCKPGVSKHKFDEMIETSACYKCGGREGLVVQWLSPNTGRALRRFSVVCANCWNLAIRERTIYEVISENNKMNHTLKR